MTLRYCDGFDHYAIADAVLKWPNGTATSGYAMGTGRFGTGQSMIVHENRGSYRKELGGTSRTWIAGAAIKCTSMSYKVLLYEFLDQSTQQVGIRFDDVGHLVAQRGDGTVLGTSSWYGSINVWYYVEAKVYVDNSAGSVEVKVNGTTVLTVTGADTQQSANNYCTAFGLSYWTGLGTPDLYMDDVYVCDSLGATNNDFLGDVRVETLMPSGAGNSAAWTPSTGSNYACVDETTANGDTDYVSSSTVDQTDTYAMGNLVTTSGTIKAVQYVLEARKANAGSRSVAAVARIGSTDYAGTGQQVLDLYRFLTEVKETSPATSSAWGIAEVNGMEYGQKVSA